MMGSPVDEHARDYDEVQRSITVSSFYAAPYEVTQREYQRIMRTNPSHYKGRNLPVESVSWFDALEYCNRLSIREGLNPVYQFDGLNVIWDRNANGYRLLTEAEWEYACRAGHNTPFNTGNNITTSQANYNGNFPYNNNEQGIFLEATAPVGSFTANSWGLYDMHGNVFEWCWDWYGHYTPADNINPAGPQSGSYKVIRGGSWFNGADILRSAYRGIYIPQSGNERIGFRIARNAE
jgi:formylglycine-generating enzyme required for sulfatase activity